MRGAVIKDIMEFNRVHEMFGILSTPKTTACTKEQHFRSNTDLRSIPNPNTIPEHSRQMTVCFKPRSGLLIQSKYTPLRYCPLEIELELADLDDPVISNEFNLPPDIAAALIASMSVSWKLESCQLKCDVCTLDTA